MQVFALVRDDVVFEYEQEFGTLFEVALRVVLGEVCSQFTQKRVLVVVSVLSR
jgi:hypothetical protein